MEALFVLAVLVAFPFMWAAVSWVLGAGWRAISDRYPSEGWPRGGHRLSMQSARIGATRYKGALNFAATESGLHIRPVVFFRLGHPPVCIPWKAVERTEPAAFSGRTLYLAGGLSLTVPERLGHAVESAVQAHREAAGPLAPEARGASAPEAETERGDLREGSRREGTGWV